jgi:DNA-binding transcriptional regulator YhcF (GntR family)
MNLNINVATVTRKLHELAVTAHIAALRMKVKAVEEQAVIEEKASNIAWAAVTKARALAHDATVMAQAAQQHAAIVKGLAEQEAEKIGGEL